MKGQIRAIGMGLAVLCAAASLSFAQAGGLSTQAQPPVPNGEPTGVSEKPAAGPGTVNYVEGQVSLDGNGLSARSIGNAALQRGGALRTEEGYAEVLLTPGAFLRVGHNSEIRLISGGLAETQIELGRGSAVLEVDQLIKGTNLAIVMNGARTEIEKQGLYGFDFTKQAVNVLDGRATVVTDAGRRSLGKHDQVLLASDKPLKKRNFDKSTVEMEPLYVWSKARSADLAQASYSAASSPGSYAAAGAGWYWNPNSFSYGFWPLAGSLYSPFGWGFYSPAYFGDYGGFGGYPGWGWYGRPGWSGHAGSWHGRPGPAWRGRPGTAHVGGVNARIGAPRGNFSHGGVRGGAAHSGPARR